MFYYNPPKKLKKRLDFVQDLWYKGIDNKKYPLTTKGGKANDL